MNDDEYYTLEKEIEDQKLLIKGLEGNLKACEEYNDEMEKRVNRAESGFLTHQKKEKAMNELEEYTCPHCEEPFSIASTAVTCVCKCGYRLLVSRDGEFVDGMWRNRTKITSPPDGGVWLNTSQTANNETLVEMLLLRQSALAKITESHPDYVTIREAKKITKEEVLIRLNKLPHITTFEKELAELRKDKERLDWLDDLLKPGDVDDIYKRINLTSDSIDLRDAIDQAIDTAAKEEK